MMNINNKNILRKAWISWLQEDGQIGTISYDINSNDLIFSKFGDIPTHTDFCRSKNDAKRMAREYFVDLYLDRGFVYEN